MNKLKTLIIDDDSHIIDELSQLLTYYSYLDIIGSAQSFHEIKKLIPSQERCLVFLDIQLKNESGLDIADYINKNYKNIYIIFITSQPEYALESYRFYPFDFLTKPLNAIRLEHTLNKIKKTAFSRSISSGSDTKIAVKSKHELYFIAVSSIQLIKKNGRKVIIITKEENFHSSETIKDLENKLQQFGFVALSRTTIIPITDIESIQYQNNSQTYTISLKSGHSIDKISLAKMRDLKSTLAEFNWII